MRGLEWVAYMKLTENNHMTQKTFQKSKRTYADPYVKTEKGFLNIY